MEKITLDMLTQDSVSVKTINTDGLIHRKAYINSIRARQEVIQELPKDIQNGIFLVWGNTATIEEPGPEPIDNVPQPPTTEERLQQAEDTILFLLMGGM